MPASSLFTKFVPLFAQSAGNSFGILNWLVLLSYLGGMVGIGVWCSRRENSTEQFFLASRKIPWWAAGLSIFGTQLSAITFMAIPATAYAENWVRMLGNIMIMAVIPVVVFLFLPFFRRLNIVTAYEYLERRFNVAVRSLASLLFIAFQLGRMGIVLFLPALALSAVTGMNIYLCIALMGVLATIYTVLGGIEAVIWTDVVQVIVLLGGALLCVGVVVYDSGGIIETIRVAQAHNKFETFVWDLSPNTFSVWVIIVGALFTNMVPYATDQTVVQRYLTTRDEKQAAGSLWLNFAITLPTALIFYGLGTALFVFYSTNPELATPDKNDQIVPWFVVNQLPPGIAGLVIAGVFAAAMSSLDSSMNSVASAFVNDFYGRFVDQTSDQQSMGVAKMVTIAIGVLGTAIALVMASIEIKYLFDLFLKFLGLFGGGLLGVFLLAVVTRRSSSAGAIVGLVSAAVVTGCLAFFTPVNLYLYAFVGAVVCYSIGYAVSLLIPDTEKSLAGLTIHTVGEAKS